MDREVAVLQVVCRYLSGLAEVTRGQREISARDQFLSIASHELKTPLTSIYGILQLQERMLRHVQAGDENMDKQRSFLKIVLRQVERLNELINGLLDVSRLQNNRFSINPADSDIGGLLYETVNSRLNVIAEEASVRIQVDAPESFRAWVDPIRFEEVVTNLGMNAIRFSPEGGTVFIRLFEQGGQAIVHFRDQGPELAETDRHRIFRPFERAQRTARLGGLGLGLYISRQIAQLHGGDVTLIESVAGKGNLFEARFPLFPPEGGKSRPSA